MRNAFTLAEVLITLGIIGVVAAMTLPALVGHYKKIETASRLKKFYSMMYQAISMSETVNGNVKDWIKPDTQHDEGGNVDYEAQGKVSREFFMQYLAPYFKYVAINDGENTIKDDGTKSGTQTTVYLADGSSFAFNNGGCMDVVFDINGDKLPNSWGRDQFVFYFCLEESERLKRCGNFKKAFCTAKNGAATRQDALRNCANTPYWCSSLLEFDGWEFKDDYPYKL